jgi:hypothetical protein
MSISDKQANFIRTLLADREVDEQLQSEAEYALENGDRQQASSIIDALKGCPFPSRQPQQQLTPDVPEGRYALPSDYDPEGTPVFYKVDHGNEGTRWEGFVFLERIVGPNEERVPRVSRDFILGAIAEDVPGALRRYGHLSGHCGNCGLELTDKFSRFIGVGPICREKLSLPKSEASFVRDGGVLPDSYLREVAAEEEAAIAGAEAATVEPPAEDEAPQERTSFRTDEPQDFGLQQLRDAVANGGRSQS